MPELLVVPLRYMETEAHAERIRAQAKQRGLSLSAYLRSIVRMHTDPDGETLKRCALTDERTAYLVDSPPKHGRYRCDGTYTTEGDDAR